MNFYTPSPSPSPSSSTRSLLGAVLSSVISPSNMADVAQTSGPSSSMTSRSSSWLSRPCSRRIEPSTSQTSLRIKAISPSNERNAIANDSICIVDEVTSNSLNGEPFLLSSPTAPFINASTTSPMPSIHSTNSPPIVDASTPMVCEEEQNPPTIQPELCNICLPGLK